MANGTRLPDSRPALREEIERRRKAREARERQAAVSANAEEIASLRGEQRTGRRERASERRATRLAAIEAAEAGLPEGATPSQRRAARVRASIRADSGIRAEQRAFSSRKRERITSRLKELGVGRGTPGKPITGSATVRQPDKKLSRRTRSEILKRLADRFRRRERNRAFMQSPGVFSEVVGGSFGEPGDRGFLLDELTRR